MPADSDLREIYRLQAECFDNHVIHTSYQSDRARNVRKVKVERRWNDTTRIGHGSFGEVWLQKSDGDERAVKKLSKFRMEDLGIDYRRELDAMAWFSRPRILEEQVIVAFLGWFESDDAVFLAMEYAPFGDLSKYIATGEIQERDAKQIARDILEALIIIHEEGFTHRDIKPQNVFVMQKTPMWWVKLGDFGITKRIDNEQTALRTRIGTARYLAPEIEDDDFPDSDYTQAVDMWSLGCVIYTILAQTPPFMTTSSKRKPFLEQALKVHLSTDATDFVRSLLAIDPAERPTAKDARSTKWFLDSDDPLDQDGLGGSSQNQTLLLKNPAEHSTAGDAQLNQLSLGDSQLEKTVIGGLSQGQTLLPTRDSGPLQLSPRQLSSPTIRRPVFAVSLERLYERDGMAVLYLVSHCIQAVDLYGLEVEGIYDRLSGNSAHVSELKAQFDTGSQTLDFRNPQAFNHDINNVTVLLKRFLGQLPDPLFTKAAYQSFIKAARIDDDIIRRDSIHAHVNSLPGANYACLRALVLHLERVMQHSATNRMNAGNLAIIFGPICMEKSSIHEARLRVQVLDTILLNCFQIFDRD